MECVLEWPRVRTELTCDQTIAGGRLIRRQGRGCRRKYQGTFTRSRFTRSCIRSRWILNGCVRSRLDHLRAQRKQGRHATSQQYQYCAAASAFSPCPRSTSSHENRAVELPSVPTIRFSVNSITGRGGGQCPGPNETVESTKHRFSLARCRWR